MDGIKTTTINVYATDRDEVEHLIPWQTGESLMEALRDNCMPVLASCGGACACATCHVYVDQNYRSLLDPPRETETELLSAETMFQKDKSRLSCQIPFDSKLDNLRVKLAPYD
jgi:ferredoxin, 2Fe-2S